MPKAKPKFRRSNYGRIRRITHAWRRPRGIDSKQRVRLKYTGAVPRIGYGTDRAARGKHPTGLMEAVVNRVQELGALKGKAARIAAKVGGKKAAEIRKAAAKLGIKVLN